MLPLPSAVKEPTRAKKPVEPLLPLIEKAYCPLRLELEKFPVGGGGIGTEPLLLQAAAKVAANRARKRATRFIARRPFGQPGDLEAAPCLHGRQPEPVESRARSGVQGPERRLGQVAQKIPGSWSFRRFASGRRSERSRLG